MYCFKKCKMYVVIGEVCHCKTNILAIATKVIFHCWKEKLDRIVVRGIWREKFTAHASVRYLRLKDKDMIDQTYLDSMRSTISGCLWMQQLSITISELGAGKCSICSNRRSMKMRNCEVSKAPSRISTWKMPSVSESASRTENLISELIFSQTCSNPTYRWPRQKNTFRTAFLSFSAHARPRYDVRRSTAFLSTKTSGSGS
jgi:hypothetical protein